MQCRKRRRRAREQGAPVCAADKRVAVLRPTSRAATRRCRWRSGRPPPGRGRIAIARLESCGRRRARSVAGGCRAIELALFSLAEWCCILSATGRSRDQPVPGVPALLRASPARAPVFRVTRNPSGAAPSRSPRASMAESTEVARAAASIPSSADIKRAEKFVRERFVHEGEDPAVALASGHAAPSSARPGARRSWETAPSTPPPHGGATSRCCSGSSGSSPMTSPQLVDGTVLSAHQVDALSGTLTALLAEAPALPGSQQRTRRRGRLARAAWPRPRYSVPTTGRAPPRRSSDASANGKSVADEQRRCSMPRTTTTMRRTSTMPTRTRTTRISAPSQRAAPEEDEEDEEDDDFEDELEEPEPEPEERGGARGGAPRLGGRGRGGRLRSARGSQRGQALLVRARHRRRQDGRRARLRRGLADRRRPDPHPPAQPRRPVPRRVAPARLSKAHLSTPVHGRGLAQGSRHGGDLPVVRTQRGPYLKRLHDRHLRRGPHRPRREDQRRDQGLDGADLHRHDRHRRAHRPARDRSVPHADIALRSGPSRASRCDRALALRADLPGRGRQDDRQRALA